MPRPRPNPRGRTRGGVIQRDPAARARSPAHRRPPGDSRGARTRTDTPRRRSPDRRRAAPAIRAISTWFACLRPVGVSWPSRLDRQLMTEDVERRVRLEALHALVVEGEDGPPHRLHDPAVVLPGWPAPCT